MVQGTATASADITEGEGRVCEREITSLPVSPEEIPLRLLSDVNVVITICRQDFDRVSCSLQPFSTVQGTDTASANYRRRGASVSERYLPCLSAQETPPTTAQGDNADHNEETGCP
uniref:Uncharacterized protein n=1 Tax=Knipowitschia caucasica TaxID=637954 RepID=A0AAV2LER6_KNICA